MWLALLIVEKLINSRTLHIVGPQAAKIACASTNRYLRPSCILLILSLQAVEKCMYTCMALIVRNAWCNFGQSCVIARFVIGVLLSEVWDDATVRIECNKPLPKCTYFKLVKSVFAQHTPYNHSACFCKLPWGCCCSQLPARPHHWAIVRHLYSVGLHPRIDVLDVSTSNPCVKRSTMSIGSQSCDHCKGQSLVVTLSYCTLSQMWSLVVPNCMPTYLVSEPVSHPQQPLIFTEQL